MRRPAFAPSLTIALAALSSLASADPVTDPGFEAVGLTLGSGSSFRPFPNFDNGWAATRTDGEVFASAPGRPAHSGTYYADLLQNAGANQNAYWDEATFTFGNYDRIVTIVDVAPNTAYDLSFWHAGGDRFGYTGATTLVQIQSLDTAAAATFAYATPGLYQWTLASASFTTDATTTRLALGFSPLGSTNASVLLDDVSFARPVPEPASLAALGLGALALLRRRSRL